MLCSKLHHQKVFKIETLSLSNLREFSGGITGCEPPLPHSGLPLGPLGFDFAKHRPYMEPYIIWDIIYPDGSNLHHPCVANSVLRSYARLHEGPSEGQITVK